jgi:hypothetical protein
VEEMLRRPLWIWVGVMKQRKPDTKCEFTLPPATLNSPEVASAENPPRGIPPPMEIAPMSRRPIVILALAISSFVLAACSDTTAPRPKADSCSGWVTSDGRCVEQ